MKHFRKHVGLVHVAADYTYNQRRLLNQLIVIAQRKPSERVFEATLAELGSAYRSRPLVAQIKEDLELFVTTPIRYNIFSRDVANQEVYLHTTRFLASLTVGVEDAGEAFSGDTPVYFEFPDAIRSLVVDPGYWANLSLEHFSQITQQRTALLLELVASYHFVDMEYARQHTFVIPGIPIETLKEYYGVKKDVSTSQFNEKWLKPGIQDLADKTPYHVEMQPVRSGREIVAIGFNVTYKPVIDVEQEEIDRRDEVFTSLISLRVPLDTAKKIMADVPGKRTLDDITYAIEFFKWKSKYGAEAVQPRGPGWLVTAIEKQYRDKAFEEWFGAKQMELRSQNITVETRLLERNKVKAVVQGNFDAAVQLQQMICEIRGQDYRRSADYQKLLVWRDHVSTANAGVLEEALQSLDQESLGKLADKARVEYERVYGTGATTEQLMNDLSFVTDFFYKEVEKFEIQRRANAA